MGNPQEKTDRERRRRAKNQEAGGALNVEGERALCKRKGKFRKREKIASVMTIDEMTRVCI